MFSFQMVYFCWPHLCWRHYEYIWEGKVNIFGNGLAEFNKFNQRKNIEKNHWKKNLKTFEKTFEKKIKFWKLNLLLLVLRQAPSVIVIGKWLFRWCWYCRAWLAFYSSYFGNELWFIWKEFCALWNWSFWLPNRSMQQYLHLPPADRQHTANSPPIRLKPR